MNQTLSRVETLLVENRERLDLARTLIAEVGRVEMQMSGMRDRLLQYAWYLGRVLAEMKEEVGHGRWLPFLQGQLPEISERNAQRCMLFFKENPANPQNSADLTFSVESIRRFTFHYVPAKERPDLPGDAPVPPITHHLTICNVWSKWRRQLSLGRVSQPPAEVLRRDCGFIVRDMAEMVGREYLIEMLRNLPEVEAGAVAAAGA